MGKSEPFAAFDQKERARVRRTLLRYMAEHVMGAYTLQKIIVRADAPRHRFISCSTLQRFLAGSRDTQDHHVALCHEFASQLPYFEEGRDIERFGETLFDFLQGPAEISERQALIERLSALAGSYEAANESLTLEPLEGQPYLHAREISPCLLVPDAESEGTSDELAARRRVHEGVLVLTSSGINMFLRNSLTRQPKLCCLWQQRHPDDPDLKVLQGESFQPGFMPGMKNTQQPVRFVPASAREKV